MQSFQKVEYIRVGLGMVNSIVCYRHYLWVTSTFTSRICVWDIDVSNNSYHCDNYLTW